MIQSWENFVTENDFIGRCPTNVEHPIKEINYSKQQ